MTSRAAGRDDGYRDGSGRGNALHRYLTLLMLAAIVALGAGQACATPTEVERESSPAYGAGTLVFDTPAGRVEAPRLHTRAEIDVGGMLARVTVRQRFHNPSAEFVEGLYVFPLPDDAAVDRLTLHVGQRVIVGEIQEKRQARETYERARRDGQRASLVEHYRPNLFRTAVANIGPGETIVVEIGYLQTLAYADGAFSLRFPMTVTPRFAAGAPLQASIGRSPADALPAMDWLRAGQGQGEAEITLQLDPGFPLARIESLYHTMDIVQAGAVYEVRAPGGTVPMDRDFELVWQPALGAAPEAAVFTESWHGEPFALLMLLPPDAAAAVSQPREVVLVIDTSGSMGGTSIAQARDALQFALGRLRPQDRFNIIRFADQVHALFREAMPVDPGYLLSARRFVDSLQADGGTNIAAALAHALDPQADARAAADGYLRQVIFVTDGSVGNEQELFTNIVSGLGRTRLFTVGIGSAPNDWFMRKAAQFGRGTFTHIGADHMIEERMEALLARLESPVLRDIEITPPAGAEIWPERVRDLYAGEPVVVRAKLRQPGGRFALRGTRDGAPWQRELALRGGRDHPGVAALWARAQIERMLDTLVTGADADPVRTDVIELALRHQLVSRYTSLVAVDRTPVRAPGLPLVPRRVPLTAPAGSAMLGYPAGATPASLLALSGTLMLGLSLGFAWLARRRRGVSPARPSHPTRLRRPASAFGRAPWAERATALRAAMLAAPSPTRRR